MSNFEDFMIDEAVGLRKEISRLSGVVADLRKERDRMRDALREAVSLVEYYRHTHQCEENDLCSGCVAAEKFLKKDAARAALSEAPNHDRKGK